MKKSTLTNAVAICSLFSNTVLATNGYWAHGYGPKSKSMSGACVAMTLEGMCNSVNPATTLGLGNSVELNLSVFAPDHGFYANNDGMDMIPPGKHDSTKDFFYIPGFNYNRMIDADSSYGITLGGNGGMNTRYSGNVLNNFSQGNTSLAASAPTGMDLMQGFIGANYTRRLNQYHTIGIMPFLAIQALETYGLQPFKMFSSDPNNLSNNGHDMSYGGGIRIGWMGHISEQITLGASYQTRSWMSRLDKYRGLLAEHGDFDIPSNYDLGFAYQPTKDLILNLGFQSILYSEVKSLSNSTELPMSPNFPLLGTDQGMGFGWDDVNVIKVGMQWNYNDDWTLRAGYSHSNQVFGSSQALLNILAPAVTHEHYTFGLSTDINVNNELSFALSYAPQVELHGVNNQVGGQSGYLYMDQWDLNIGWTWHF